MNADEEVMRYLPSTLTREKSDEFAQHTEAHIDRLGWGWWALEERATGAFIGFAGLGSPSFVAHFTPCIEIGWRLIRTAWGKGFATEAGKRAAAFAFEDLELDEIVSITARINQRSQAVMKRLGMTRSANDDFDHPGLEEDNPLRSHVLYRLTAEHWRTSLSSQH